MANQVSFTRQEFQHYYEVRLGTSLRPNSEGEARARCPHHNDRRPSLCVNVESGLWNCHAGCGGGTVFDFEMSLAHVEFAEAKKRIFEAIGRHESPASGERTIAATYDYFDEQGVLRYQIVRFQPKGFAQRRPDGEGGWVWNMDGVRHLPYGLPKLMSASEVFVVEGEKDVNRLASEDVVAATNSGGAGKWRPEFAEFFKDKHVVIVPDNDDAGRKHANDVVQSLHSVASVKVVHLPGLKEKEDISDWLDQGHTKEELLQLAAATSPWTPKPAVESVLDKIPNVFTLEIPEIEYAVPDLLALGCVTLLSGAPDS
jgi:putative DNA primase/helicase